MYTKEREILKNPLKTYQNLAIPLILFAVFDAFYMLIDALWANLIGVEGMIAVGISVPILTLIIKFGTTLGQGTNSFMSQSFGNCNPKQANNTLLHGLTIGIIASIIIPLITIPFLKEIIGIFSYKGAMNQINYYLIPLLLCSFIFILNGLLSETIQSEGDSKRPTAFMIMGNIINLILSPLLAFKCGLGILGLSIGTVIGNMIPLILFLYTYFSHKIISKLSYKEFSYNSRIIKEIIKVTLPNYIDRSLASILTIYVTIILTMVIGVEYITIYTFFMLISELVQSPSRGSSRGILTVTGHLYGAKKINKIKKICKFGLLLGVLMSIITSVLLLTFHDYVFTFLNSPLIDINKAHDICFVIVIINLLIPITFVVSKILDGLGRSIYSLLGTLIKIGLTIIFIAIFAFITNYHGWSVPFGILLAEIIIVFYYTLLIQRIFKKIEKKYPD